MTKFDRPFSALHRTLFPALLAVALGITAQAQAPSGAAQEAGKDATSHATPSGDAGLGAKDSPSKSAKTGVDPKSAAKPATGDENSASAVKLRLGPLDPSTPPKDLPKNRPVVGVALGGGAAIALSEVGVLQWFEEHHIPVDVIAGTSMGSILGALYSTGHTPAEMEHILDPKSVTRVFRISSDYSNLSYRRREDERELPNAIGIGLKHGPSLRNSLLTDTGLNDLLDREFLNYNDQTDFNNLPIPFRCQATDLNAAKTVTFSRGSLQNAVRASASIPGVFRPFELFGNEYVDGAILQNLPTADVRAMHADVVIAVSMPLEPVGKGDLNSILDVLQRAFAVGIENNEAASRKLANILIMPDVKGFSAGDYLKSAELAKRGYDAAEAHKAELMKLALPDAEWNAYLAHRLSKERGPAGNILQVKVQAPNADVTAVANRLFQPLVNQPVDLDKVESLLADIRSDGRYDADYTIGYDGPDSNRPIILVAIQDKKNGPPYLELGANVAAQTGGVTRASLNSIFLWQDLGGYGSSLRVHANVGFTTLADAEYYRRLDFRGYFAAPHGGIVREPFYIYNGNFRSSERQYQQATVGGDMGWSDGHKQELRAGFAVQRVDWTVTTGYDNLPNYAGPALRARAHYVFDSQDRALVPRYGLRTESEAGYLFDMTGSPAAPYFQSQLTVAHTIDKKNIVLLKGEGGTLFNRDVPQPFRFTLGGPLRVGALATDQLRGTDYFLVVPGYMHRIATLPAPLGQSIYVGASYEAGQMRAPDQRTVLRQDFTFGIIAETPLGVITFAPAIGDGGNRKFNFTLGKLF